MSFISGLLIEKLLRVFLYYKHFESNAIEIVAFDKTTLCGAETGLIYILSKSLKS